MKVADTLESDYDRFEPHYFGNCPKCKGCDGNLNVEYDHYFVCHQCKTYWYVGSNLFSYWRDQTEEEWGENRRLLDGYEPVEALYLPEANSPWRLITIRCARLLKNAHKGGC